jgi:hypothetical protein
MITLPYEKHGPALAVLGGREYKPVQADAVDGPRTNDEMRKLFLRFWRKHRLIDFVGVGILRACLAKDITAIGAARGRCFAAPETDVNRLWDTTRP